MSDTQIVPCTNCGAQYPLTRDYLAQYGGQQSQCRQCGQPFLIPSLPAEGVTSGPPPVVAPVQVLPYRGTYVDPQIATGGVWREGMQLIATSGATLPMNCVKCNGPAEGPPRRVKLVWHHPAIYLTILAGLLVYVIVALCVRKSGTVQVSLCRQHKKRRRTIIIGAWSSIPIAIGLFILAGQTNYPEAFVPTGIILLLAAPFVGLYGQERSHPRELMANNFVLRL